MPSPPVSRPVLSRLTNYLRKSDKKDTPPPTPMFSMNRMYSPVYPTTDSPVLGIPHNTNVSSAQAPEADVDPRELSDVERQNKKTAPVVSQTQVTDSNKILMQGKSPGPAVGGYTPIIRHVNSWFSKNDLKRRPLHTYETRDPAQYSFSATKNNIKGKFLSAFGFSEKHEMPAGLRNEGQNLCFMNCILQCLSHTPCLVDKLYEETSEELDCSETESAMMESLALILSKCQKTKNEGVLDPALFREAVSLLNGSLITALTEKQYQQDAAEFFMWLIQTLHNALNKKPSTGEHKPLAVCSMSWKGAYMSELPKTYSIHTFVRSGLFWQHWWFFFFTQVPMLVHCQFLRILYRLLLSIKNDHITH